MPGLSFLEEEIRRWQQGVLDGYCKSCSDTCCNGRKHRICADSSSISLFQERGIPVIRKEDLDLSSVRFNVLLLRQGRAVSKPAVVEVPRNMWGDEWYIYSDYCPFYKNNRCEVHEDPRRPSVCKKYPLMFFGASSLDENSLNIGIMPTCECFRKKEVREELIKKFNVHILENSKD